MDIKTTKQPDGYWVAIDADKYEAECDDHGWWSNSPAGYGATEAEAIRELLEDTIMRGFIAPVLIEIIIVLLGIVAAVVIIKEIM